MTQLTKEELHHLAKLSAIKIDTHDEETLLPQLENIIEFVAKLNDCDLEWISDRIEDNTITCNEWIKQWIDKKDFLQNAKHPTDSGMIMLDVSTNE